MTIKIPMSTTQSVMLHACLTQFLEENVGVVSFTTDHVEFTSTSKVIEAANWLASFGQTGAADILLKSLLQANVDQSAA